MLCAITLVNKYSNVQISFIKRKYTDLLSIYAHSKFEFEYVFLFLLHPVIIIVMTFSEKINWFLINKSVFYFSCIYHKNSPPPWAYLSDIYFVSLTPLIFRCNLCNVLGVVLIRRMRWLRWSQALDQSEERGRGLSQSQSVFSRSLECDDGGWILVISIPG